MKHVEIIRQYIMTKQNTENNMLNRISVGLLLNPSITKTEQGYYLYSTFGDGKKCFHSVHLVSVKLKKEFCETDLRPPMIYGTE